MTRIRAVVLVFLAVVAAVTLFVPPAREEVAWVWTKFQDRAPNYLAYITERPNGRHVIEARTLYEKRRWAAAKRTLIRDAYQETAQPNAAEDRDAARQERQSRREAMFWKHATDANTVASYEDYLSQYPRGQFMAKARSQIQALKTTGAAP